MRRPRYRGIGQILHRHRCTRAPFLAAVASTALVLAVAVAVAAPTALAQQPEPAHTDSGGPAASPPRVFLDCSLCPQDRILQEITFVIWVRDRTDADVHALVTQQVTGSGGSAYTIFLLGRRALEGRADTLYYTSERTNTPSEIADGLLGTLALGLLRYATPAADGTLPAAPKLPDPWHAWVFTVGLNGSLMGEQSYKSASFSTSLAAGRTTEASKLSIALMGTYHRTAYSLTSTSSFVNSQRDFAAQASAVWSAGPHWSAGLTASAMSATFLNKDWAVQGGPALEYDVFPYADFTRRQLTFRYSVQPQAARYTALTIFDKNRETLVAHRLDVGLNLAQPWGSAASSVSASQFLGDWSKYEVTLTSGLSLRLFRGLSLTLNGTVSRIKDQVYLSKAGLTNDEILTRRQQLGTDYRYLTLLGFSYQFGSAVSGVVNPRMF